MIDTKILDQLIVDNPEAEMRRASGPCFTVGVSVLTERDNDALKKLRDDLRSLKWTNEVPSRTGWYWCQNVGDVSPVWEAVVHFDSGSGYCSWLTRPGEAGRLHRNDFSPATRWAGPIEPPIK